MNLGKKHMACQSNIFATYPRIWNILKNKTKNCLNKKIK